MERGKRSARGAGLTSVGLAAVLLGLGCEAKSGLPRTDEVAFSWGVAAIGAPEAWRRGATGRGVRVAVIDVGVHTDHPELAGAIDGAGSDDVSKSQRGVTGPKSHGSEAAFIIAGAANGTLGVGVAYESKIIALRADNVVGGFDAEDLARAIDQARDADAKVISMSLGDADPGSSAASPLVADALARATRAGVLVVMSAGNLGNVGATEPTFPARFAQDPAIANGRMIVAGGLNPDGARNPASNPAGGARDVYLMAPGWGLSAPDFANCTAGAAPCGSIRIGGTSFAAAHVAGAAAALLGARPGLSADEAAALLLGSADDLGAPGADALYGRGKLNLARAVAGVANAQSVITKL